MSSNFIEISNALANAVESASKSVVTVKGRRRHAASGIVWREDGIIVTANHVVRRDEGISIGLADGASAEATIAGRDPSTDLAVLRVEGASLTAAEHGSDPRVGHLVLALGRPGANVEATLGIISALDNEGWQTAMAGKIDQYMQTDVLMYPGFSGGPLVDSAGRVLGLNSSALLRGVSVTVPLATVSRVVETLLTHGAVKRGYLGLSTQTVRLAADIAEELGQKSALLVVNVESDSPAEEGGMVMGDAIVALDGERVRHHDDLLSLLSGDRVGRKAPVRVVRGGELRTLNVTIGEREPRPRRRHRHRRR